MSTDHNFSRERTAEKELNRGLSAYQRNALPLGHTGPQGTSFLKTSFDPGELPFSGDWAVENTVKCHSWPKRLPAAFLILRLLRGREHGPLMPDTKQTVHATRCELGHRRCVQPVMFPVAV